MKAGLRLTLAALLLFATSAHAAGNDETHGYRVGNGGYYKLSDGSGPYSFDGTSTFTLLGSGSGGGSTNCEGSTTGGSGGSKSCLQGGIYKVTPPTLTDGQQAGIRLTADGSVAVAGGIADNTSLSSQTASLISGQALSAFPSAKTTTNNAFAFYDLYGRQVTMPFANPENAVSGAILPASAMTGTTSTLLVAAPGAGLRNWITHIHCTNSHATVGTFVNVQDGSGGTAFWTLSAAAVYGGETDALPYPLKQPTANTGLYVVDVTTGANVVCSANGFKAP